MTAQLEIGQIVYVLSNKNQQILPGIVLEEILHRRMDGHSVSYKVAIGPNGKQKVVDLTEVDGEIFNSLEEVRQVMVEKLTMFVDNLCAKTNQIVVDWYGDQRSGVIKSSGGKMDPADLLNEVSAPTYPQQNYVQQPRQQPQQVAQATSPQQLRSQMTDPELLQREITMPDGSVQKVTL